jgi:flagellar hook-associated protein 2
MSNTSSGVGIGISTTTGTAPVQLSGLASGIDTKSIVSGLVAAESIPMQQMQQQAAQLRAAVTDISALSTALSNFKTAADALGLQNQVGSFTASSTDSTITASALPTAQTGSYAVNVTALAQEQRTYSASFSDHTTALNQTGSFTLQAGGAAAANTSVVAGDTLDTIATKINAAGVRASASVFYDGTSYRLQIRGLDTGAANKLTFTESGTALDLNGTGNTSTAGRTAQVAQDAAATVDGFNVTSPTNKLVGVIPGVTLALTKITSSPATISVATDPNTLSTKLSAFVTAYNTVINDVHKMAGYGTSTAQDPTLAGDSALRSVTSRMQRTLGAVYGSGKYDVLATIGISSNRDGTLLLDSTKLNTAFSADSASVENMLGRAQGASTGGAMATLRDLAATLTDPTNGVLTLRSKQLNDQAKLLDDRATREQTRITSYQTLLQSQFTAMENAYSKNQALIAQLAKI